MISEDTVRESGCMYCEGLETGSRSSFRRSRQYVVLKAASVASFKVLAGIIHPLLFLITSMPYLCHFYPQSFISFIYS